MPIDTTPVFVPFTASAEGVASRRAEALGTARVRKYYELVDNGDVAGLVSLFAPDAQYHRPGYAPLIGHSALTWFYTGQRMIREGRHTLTAVIARDRDIAAHGEFSGVLRDGREVTLRFCDVFALGSDGLFTRRDTFFFAPMV